MVWAIDAPLVAGRLVLSDDAAPWASVRSLCSVASMPAGIRFGSTLATCVSAPARPLATVPAAVMICVGVRAMPAQLVSVAARGTPRMARRDRSMVGVPFRLLAGMREPPEGRQRSGQA